jgi:hypothetical protein
MIFECLEVASLMRTKTAATREEWAEAEKTNAPFSTTLFA